MGLSVQSGFDENYSEEIDSLFSDAMEIFSFRDFIQNMERL